jgi:serine/threonine-protein kinase RsbT
MKFHYRISGGDFVRAGEAASRLKRILEQLGIEASLVRRISIVAYELELNVVIHAKRGELSVEISPNCVTMVCKDQGAGIGDLKLAMQEGYSTAPPQVRELGFGAGMGLPNIRRCSDSLNIESNPGQGTTVVATINL